MSCHKKNHRGLKIFLQVFIYVAIVLIIHLLLHYNANVSASKPLPPKDLRLLPLSNTELDVDIYPPDVNPVDGEVIGEPTRYNISYEFRIWKYKTKREEISLEQSTGIAITYMKMESPLNFKSFKDKPANVIDYVYNIMSAPTFATRKSRSPVPLNTCANNICVDSLTSLTNFKNEKFSS